jgi:hypothetical protein
MSDDVLIATTAFVLSKSFSIMTSSRDRKARTIVVMAEWIALC